MAYYRASSLHSAFDYAVCSFCLRFVWRARARTSYTHYTHIVPSLFPSSSSSSSIHVIVIFARIISRLQELPNMYDCIPQICCCCPYFLVVRVAFVFRFLRVSTFRWWPNVWLFIISFFSSCRAMDRHIRILFAKRMTQMGNVCRMYRYKLLPPLPVFVASHNKYFMEFSWDRFFICTNDVNVNVARDSVLKCMRKQYWFSHFNHPQDKSWIFQ